jgi:hypothetical protein
VGRLLKIQRDAHADIGALARRVGVGAAAAAESAEAAAEDIAEQIAQIHAPAAGKSVEPAAEAAALARAVGGVHAGKAELIVLGALVGIAEDLVGLVDLLEFFLGFLVAGVIVRVILQGQLAVRLFDLLGAGALGDAQHLIVVSFFCHTPLTLPKRDAAPRGSPRIPRIPANAAPVQPGRPLRSGKGPPVWPGPPFPCSVRLP